jgi:thymidine phosphorylase
MEYDKDNTITIRVEKSDPLFTIYAEARGELDYFTGILQNNADILKPGYDE